MLEFFSDPPWWIILLIGWAMPSYAWFRAQIPRLAQIPSLVSSAHSASWQFLHGKLRAFFRGREKKRLQKIKAARFHGVQINRQIARSYAFLVLFIVSALFFFSGAAMLSLGPQKAGPYSTLWMIITGPFGLVFELLWLITSGRVDSLLKYRRKIRRQRMRLI